MNIVKAFSPLFWGGGDSDLGIFPTVYLLAHFGNNHVYVQLNGQLNGKEGIQMPSRMPS